MNREPSRSLCAEIITQLKRKRKRREAKRAPENPISKTMPVPGGPGDKGEWMAESTRRFIIRKFERGVGGRVILTICLAPC